MEVMTLLLFVGAFWVLFGIALFAHNLRTEGHQHVDRLALLPLEDNWQDSGHTSSSPDGKDASR